MPFESIAFKTSLPAQTVLLAEMEFSLQESAVSFSTTENRGMEGLYMQCLRLIIFSMLIQTILLIIVIQTILTYSN